MKGYQGEFPVDLAKTKFADYGPADWAMYFIENYGQIDGDHHKAWVLDQVARLLKGTGVTVVEARWANGVVDEAEYRVTVDDPSDAYIKWNAEMQEGGYNEGVAP